MKRSWSTMQRVLETAEGLGLGETSEHWDKEHESFFYHAKLLCAEGYLVCNWDEDNAVLTIQRMSMSGHDLLDRLRQCRTGESPLTPPPV